MKDKFTAPEMKLIDLTIRMFTEPKLELNKGLLVRHLAEVRAKKEELLDSVAVDKDTLMSNPKFAAILESMKVKVPMKTSPTTGLQTYALAKTDEGFKELLEHEDPYVQALAAARIGNKSTIEETRTENFINIANRGLLPVPLKYSGAVVSHRWSGVDGINLQNLPRTSELRRAICAPKGYKIVASDLSNIELRLAYWFAKSHGKIQQIKDGIDLYKQSAADITGTPYNEVNKDLRFIFKVVNLSGIYGVGANKMHSILKQGGVEKDLNEVKNIVYAYRRANPELVSAWADAGTMLESVRANHYISV
jgi:DNA polymerase I-like protein with 3'-5' exonuclease and polymerase domains